MVELIPRQERKPLFGQWFFFIASFLLIGGVGIGFFILDQLENNAKDILVSLQETLLRDTRPQEEALATELSAYKEKIDRLSAAASEREDFLRYFTFLEDSIIDGVYLTRFEADRDSAILAFEGVANSFLDLERQRLLWKSQEQIKQVDIMNMLLGGDGTISFQAELAL